MSWMGQVGLVLGAVFGGHYLPRVPLGRKGAQVLQEL